MEKTTTPESFIPPNLPLTPMLSQYVDMKRQYSDCILFYRMGDFYEMFFDDAIKASAVLELTLTSRDKNAAQPIPMCGVPYHSVTPYLQKLVTHGFKVAICEQVEDPATAKGIVKRDVVRVVTPALIGDPDLVNDEVTNFLVCLAENEKGQIEIALFDLLGSEVKTGEVSEASALLDLFYSWQPKEILIANATADKKWARELLSAFPSMTVTCRSEYFVSNVLQALGSYLKETQKLEPLSCLTNPSPLFEAQSLQIDNTSASSLEIVRSNTSPDGASLFKVLDFTSTPMGRRRLKEWISRPLGAKSTIEARLDSVEELLRNAALSESLRSELSAIRDLERLTTKTSLGLSMPRDLVAIREILKRVPTLKAKLKAAKSKLLKTLGKQLACLESLTAHLEKALDDNPASGIRDGGIFKDDFLPEIAELRALSRDAKGTIAAMEAREKERTGISSLKVKYSKVFGYTLEITRSHLTKVPKEYIRKQTIANGERYITEELKNFEEKIVTADDRLKRLEESQFLQLRNLVGESAASLFLNAKSIADLDVLLSFARAARERGYVRPSLHDGWELSIDEGRHPVIETLLSPGAFVPNSISFDSDHRTWILTGPNMGGKSTIMRQVALIAIMAHAGSFVPARSARISVLDAIYTRIGSQDDLARGRSTFMVEMSEVARILSSATPKSLLVIDEIGRGTSTYDGLSLAWSLLEYVHQELQSKTLFATHFHELTHLEKSLPAVRNANVLVERWNEKIVFLYKLASGACSQSYGVEVARLAGLPDTVLQRAKTILGLLETTSQKGNRVRSRALDIHENQLAFFEELIPSETRPGLDA